MHTHAHTHMHTHTCTGYRDFPVPSFAAFLAFELHERGSETVVRIVYNPDPDVYGFPNDPEVKAGRLQPLFVLDMPGSGDVVSFPRRPPGREVPFGLFKFLLTEDRRSFASEAEWNAAAKGDPEELDATPKYFSRPNTPRAMQKTTRKTRMGKSRRAWLFPRVCVCVCVCVCVTWVAELLLRLPNGVLTLPSPLSLNACFRRAAERPDAGAVCGAGGWTPEHHYDSRPGQAQGLQANERAGAEAVPTHFQFT